jgi:predicted transcriptional regulator
MLKPQDVFCCVKVLVKQRASQNWTFRELAGELEISLSEVHNALERAGSAGLYSTEEKTVLRRPFLEFLKGGLRYVYYTKPGSMVRGMATAHSAPPLNENFPEPEEKYVWPYEKGDQRGLAIEPLYQSVPVAAKRDQQLYEWLNLMESIRVGRTRERDMALRMCKKRLD